VRDSPQYTLTSCPRCVDIAGALARVLADAACRSMPRHITRCPCVLAPRTNGTNDWLGTVIIPIGDMNATNGDEKWYPLERDVAHVKNEHVEKGKDPQGDIKIKCQFLNPVRTQYCFIRLRSSYCVQTSRCYGQCAISSNAEACPLLAERWLTETCIVPSNSLCLGLSLWLIREVMCVSLFATRMASRCSSRRTKL
jgi:hypothetical protein